MKINDLLELYKNFSDEEIKEFGKFLNSPFLNKIKSLINIFNEIIKNRDLIVLLEDEKLLKKLSRKFSLSKGALSKQFTYLSKATLDYFRIKSLLNDKSSSEIALNEYLSSIKAFNILKKRIGKISEDFETDKIIEDNSILYSYRNNIIIYDMLLQSLNLKNRQGSDLMFKILHDATSDITLYSLVQWTGIYVNYFFLDVNFGFKKINLFPINLEDKFKDYSRNNLFNGNKWKKLIFEIYYALFNAINKRDDNKNYFNYKIIIINNVDILGKELIKFHYQVLINYCMTKDRLGEDKELFKNESVKLLYEYFNKNYFKVSEDYLKPLEYSNFVGRAYSVGDFEILKSFIENNSTKLNPSDYSDLVNYGLAYYYFGIKDFRKVLKHINEISLSKFLFRFDIRNLEIRVYYELNKFETLREAIHNYRSLILEDKVLTNSDKEGLLKMLSYVNKLIILNDELDSGKRKNEAEFIVISLEKEPIFSLKKWLTEKYLLIIDEDKSKKLISSI